MSFPTGDWQFWVVTIVFVVSIGYLLRGFRPGRAKRRRQQRATLTVGGKPIDG